MKRPVFKKIFNAIAPIVRGIVKAFPFGNIVVEAAQNVQYEIEKKKDSISAEIKNAIPDIETPKDSAEPSKPHRWRSIIFQSIGVGFIIYAFYTKMITIEQALEMLNKILSVLKFGL